MCSSSVPGVFEPSILLVKDADGRWVRKRLLCQGSPFLFFLALVVAFRGVGNLLDRPVKNLEFSLVWTGMSSHGRVKPIERGSIASRGKKMVGECVTLGVGSRWASSIVARENKVHTRATPGSPRILLIEQALRTLDTALDFLWASPAPAFRSVLSPLHGILCRLFSTCPAACTRVQHPSGVGVDRQVRGRQHGGGPADAADQRALQHQPLYCLAGIT